MAPPFEIHFTRFHHRFFETALDSETVVPLNGLIVVPAQVEEPHMQTWVAERTEALAPRLLLLLATTDRNRYASLVGAGMFTPEIRAQMRFDLAFRLPPENIPHTRPATNCQACYAAFMCYENATQEAYAASRAQFDQAAADYRGDLTPEGLLAVEEAANGLYAQPF